MSLGVIVDVENVHITPRAIACKPLQLGKKMQKSEKIRYERLIYSLYKIQLSAIFPPVLKSLEAKIQDGRHFTEK